MAWARVGIALAVAVLAAGLTLSGGTAVDPPPPSGFPGVVPALLSKAGTERTADAGRRGGDETRAATERDRRWLAQAKPLGDATPRWAMRLYGRSLLVLRAAVGRDGGAVAGARAGWAYVWPRDAAIVAIALASAGYRAEARRVARFLLDLELGTAARFDLAGEPVDGRAAQGDAAGWAAAAALAAGIGARPAQSGWRGLADYQEKDGGDYLGNAIASAFADDEKESDRAAALGQGREIARRFAAQRGLVRVASDADSGLDSAAAWAVRPFPQPALFPAARRTLLHLAAERKSRFGLVPSESWDGGEDPWTAPTAWTAWSLAALGERQAALRLMADLRRAATPLGLLPERVDADTGLPTSTTPLAWSHAFAILAIRELWPGRAGA
ncbi:MAG: glycoside hydrolase family 15 protein [Solirubrobacterales bacterium]